MMKKTYLVEFTHSSGLVEEVELITDNIEWSIQQWCRNRNILKHEVISEGSTNSKGMLYG